MTDIRSMVARLEELYKTYNRRDYVCPDPLQFLYGYPDPKDREIVGLVASCLAYGRVGQILKSISAVLSVLDPPAAFLKETDEEEISAAFSRFRHRFTPGPELASLLLAARRVIAEHGSLEECFLGGYTPDAPDVSGALSRFVRTMRTLSPSLPPYLLPDPAQKSACKRPLLFLRWMVRRDDVDPGGWDGISPSRLLIPLDAHMFRIAGEMGLTRRKAADLRTALEVTSRFREIAPEDPVKYDFVLTRFGIRKDKPFIGSQAPWMDDLTTPHVRPGGPCLKDSTRKP